MQIHMRHEPLHLRSAAADTPRERLSRGAAASPVPTAVIAGVGWLGGVILRLTAFLFARVVVIDHDRCTAATPLAGIAEAADAGRLKVEAAAQWGERRGVRVIAIAHRVQSLGLGFWRWAARGGAQVWCALDNPFAVAACTQACRQVGLTAVTANMELTRGLVRVLAREDSAACYHCLGTGLSRAGKGCVDALLSRASSPTVAAPAIAEHVAALAVEHGLAACRGADGSYELRWHGAAAPGIPHISRHRLPCSPQCPKPHARVEPSRVIHLEARSSEVTLADVREAATDEGDARVELDGGRLALMLQCARRCGAPPVWRLRPASALTEEDLCPHCAGELVPLHYAAGPWTGRERTVRGKSLRELGLPFWPVLRVEGAHGAREVEIAGDRECVLPEDYNEP